jgi:hypothetical protein
MDEDFEAMNLERLLHVETDLRQQNEQIDKNIAALRRQGAQLGVQRESAEKDYLKLVSGRAWEARQKLNKDKELLEATADLKAKQDQIAKINEHAEILRKEIRVYEQKLEELQANKTLADETYSNPSIVDVVEATVQELGPVPQRILNKTIVALLYPTVLTGVQHAQSIQNKIRDSSRQEAMASTFAIYAFTLLLIMLVYRGYRRISGKLSLPRVVFAMDLCIAAFWAFVVVCYAGLFEDPLTLMRTHYEPTFICMQVLLGLCYICLIFMRCVILAVSLQAGEGWEVLCSLFVVQDFYQNIWKPSLTDAVMGVGASTYCWYVLTHLFLAARRARQMVLGGQNGKQQPDGKGIGAGSGLLGPQSCFRQSVVNAIWHYALAGMALVQSLVIAMTPSAAESYAEDCDDDTVSLDDEMASVVESDSRVLFCADSYYSSRGK